MKIWAIILSIYVTLLAVIPCCAFDNCPDDKVTTEQAGHDRGDEDGCGTCSPFFNCSTCHSLFLTASTSTITQPAVLSNRIFISQYVSFVPEHHSGKIWQPPKSL